MFFSWGELEIAGNNYRTYEKVENLGRLYLYSIFPRSSSYSSLKRVGSVFFSLYTVALFVNLYILPSHTEPVPQLSLAAAADLRPSISHSPHGTVFWQAAPRGHRETTENLCRYSRSQVRSTMTELVKFRLM